MFASRRKGGRDGGRSRATRGMAPTARACPLLLPRLRGDVVDDVVGSGGIPAHARWHVVEQQEMPCLPTDIVIGARGVAAHAQAPYELPLTVVKSEPTTEYVDPANLSTLHRIVSGTIVSSVSAIGDLRIHRVAV